MKSNTFNWERLLWISLLLFLLLWKWDIPGVDEQLLAKKQITHEEQIELVTQVLNEVRNHYVDSSYISNSYPLIEGAIKGILSSLNDPHTYYLNPKEFKRLNSQIEGHYGGIGLYVLPHKNYLTVLKSIKNSPAERAGIIPGDIITAVNNTDVRGMSLSQLDFLLLGPLDSVVFLKIQREGHENPLNFRLIRKDINLPNVEYKILANEKVAYIKVASFGEKTAEQFKKAIKKINLSETSSLIIDLRNNPGGLLNVVCEMVDFFIKRGEIVYTKDRDGNKHQPIEYQATEQVLIPSSVPIIVLINEYSASAGEIFAGALQDHKRAVLLGKKSFGKFSVQKVFPFELGGKSAIKMTTTHYYLPSGRFLDKQGIKPDIEVEMDFYSKKEKEILKKNKVTKEIEQFVERNKKIFLEGSDEEKEKLVFLLQENLKEKNHLLTEQTIQYRIFQYGKLKNMNIWDETLFDRQLKEAIFILEAYSLLNHIF